MSDSAPGPISDEERAAIDLLHQRARLANHFELLGVPRSADRKAVRDAYFAFAKVWHPDVFYQRDLGHRRPMLDEIFRAVTAAYDTLSNAKARAAYEAKLAPAPDGWVPPPMPGVSVAPSPAPQPPPSPAATQSHATQSYAPQPTVAPPPRPSPPAMAAVGPTPMPSSPNLNAVLAPAGSPVGQASVPPRPLSVPAPPMGAAPPMSIPPRAGPQVGSPTSLPPPRMPSSLPPPRINTVGAAADPALRQRAMEAMARKIEATVGAGVKARATLPPPRVLSHMSSPEEVKAAQLRQLLEQSDEARARGDFDHALEFLKTAEALDRHHPELRQRLDAVGVVVAARRFDELLAKAEEARKDGKLSAAVELYERAVEQRFDAAAATAAAELCLQKKELHRKAADLSQKTLLAKPDHLPAMVVLFKVFMAAEMGTSARGMLDRIAKLDPNHALVKEHRPKSGAASLVEQLGIRNRGA
ncbi:MAG: DnaJ domain-containing protein [Myxococcales bacterium]|nr:DnaJ domain-containing protein [Myxococcales bacterium]